MISKCQLSILLPDHKCMIKRRCTVALSPWEKQLLLPIGTDGGRLDILLPFGHSYTKHRAQLTLASEAMPCGNYLYIHTQWWRAQHYTFTHPHILCHTSTCHTSTSHTHPTIESLCHTHTNTYQDGQTYLLFLLLVFHVVEEAKMAHTNKDIPRQWPQVMSPQ